MERDLTTRIFDRIIPPEHLEQQKDLEAFVEYMNRKAETIGMSQSHFEDAAGMHNLSTARDLLRLAVYAKEYPVLNAVWCENAYTVTVEGPQPRTKECAAKSQHPDLNDHYRVLGRKGGTLMCSRKNLFVYNLVSFLEIPGSADKLAVVVMYAPGNRQSANNCFAATRQVADIAMKKYIDPEGDISDMPVCCENAIAAVLPADGSCYEDLRILYEKDADAKGRPMSISKVLTAVCVLDWVEDLQEKIEYHELDTNIGGFYVNDFQPGDRMTYADALYAMMLESSNVTAQALARCVGNSIRKKQ